MKKYGEYKGADIPWIDSVPSHWQINNIWQLFFEVKCKNTGMQENNLLSLSYGKVVRRNINATEGLLPENFEGYNIIEANDIVLRLTDLQNDHKSLRTGLCRERGIITSAYLTLRANNQDNAQYIQLLLHTYDIYKVFYNIGASGVRQSLNWDTFKTLKVLLPPRSEQDQIVRYLDYKTAKIDKLISGYKRQIELLEERKRSFAYYTAIQGLSQSIDKRKSDIYWLDYVPANWKTKSIAQLCCEVKCKNTGMIEDNLLSLSYGTIKQRDINATDGLLPESFDGYNIIEKNDIVLRLTDLQNDHKSLRTGISKERGIITSAYLTIRNKSDNNAEYIQLFLHAFDLAKGFYNIGASGVRQSLNWDIIKTLRILIPPIEEQKKIVSAIKAEYQRIEKSKEAIRKQIDLLQEYRTRLISDVVTGQVDVRDEVIPEMR